MRVWLSSLGLVAIALWADCAMAREIMVIQSDISATEAAISAQSQKVNTTRAKVAAIESQLQVADQAVRDRRQAQEAAQESLRRISEVKIDHPEVSEAKERAAYEAAKKDSALALQNQATLKQQLTQARTELAEQQNIYVGMQRDLDALNNEIESARYERVRQQVEQDRTVEASAEVSCGDMSIKDCKQLALDTAKRNAIEKGSAMAVESATQVQNFRLTKDEIRTSVRGIIKSIDELDKHMVGEGSGYYYKIRAVVRGEMPQTIEPLRKAEPQNTPYQSEQIPQYKLSPSPEPTSHRRPDLTGHRVLGYALVGSLNNISSTSGGSNGNCSQCSYTQYGVEWIFPSHIALGLSTSQFSSTISGAATSPDLIPNNFDSNSTTGVSYNGSSINVEALYYFGDTYHFGLGGFIGGGSGSGTEVDTGHSMTGSVLNQTNPLTSNSLYGLFYSALFDVGDSGVLGFRLAYMYMRASSSGTITPPAVYGFSMGIDFGWRL